MLVHIVLLIVCLLNNALYCSDHKDFYRKHAIVVQEFQKVENSSHHSEVAKKQFLLDRIKNLKLFPPKLDKRESLFDYNTRLFSVICDEVYRKKYGKRRHDCKQRRK